MAQLWTRKPLFMKCQVGPYYDNEMLHQYHSVLGHILDDDYLLRLRAIDPERHVRDLGYQELMDVGGYLLSDEVRKYVEGVCHIEASVFLGMTVSTLRQVSN